MTIQTTFRSESIPAEMRALNQWVCFRIEKRGEKNTKIPVNANNGRPAATNNPLTWATFEKACRASDNFDGIGFVFSGDDGFFGIDMDGHIDQELVDWFGSYAERSFSGNGCHIIGKGKMPDHKGKRCDGIELYSKGRYFVVTGDVIHPEPIVECQDKLDELLRSFFSEPVPVAQGVDLSAFLRPAADPDIIQEIRASAQGSKFSALWAGDNTGYPSNSEADAALLSMLRWWTYGSQADSIALFKQSGRVRAKTDRPDYLSRTFATITGPVRERIESLPAMVVAAKSSPPWRKITIEHVEEAIRGTILETLTDAIRSPSLKPLPLEVGLAKALPLCGCALCGKMEKPRTLGEYSQRGIGWAKCRIMTGGGQALNFWTLLIGQSATGKDIGGIVDNAAHAFKWSIGTAGSEEGIADAYIAKNQGLLSISEMMNWLDPRHWQSRASGFLLDAFNRGHFTFAMSKRGDSQQRASDYCYPNIVANVQPGVLESRATSDHVETGFLGRFLVMQMPNFVAYPRSSDLVPETTTVIQILKFLATLQFDITIPDYYNKPLNDMFESFSATPGASWRRLTSEYYPRLALLLSIRLGDSTVVITDEAWRRASILVQYFFAQAEAVFGGLHFDVRVARFEGLQKRILDVIRAAGGRCQKAEISYKVGRGSTSAERNQAILELEERSRIAVEKSGKCTTLVLRE